MRCGGWWLGCVAWLVVGAGCKEAPSAAPGAAPGVAQRHDDGASIWNAEGVKLIDVRTPGEFAGGHLPGAINVPVSDLDGIAAAVGARDAPAVIYCASGARSGHAVKALQARGYTRLVNGGGARAAAARLGVTLVR